VPCLDERGRPVVGGVTARDGAAHGDGRGSGETEDDEGLFANRIHRVSSLLMSDHVPDL
jgi:hypothetical protein